MDQERVVQNQQIKEKMQQLREFSLEGYFLKVEPLKVYDGDTVWLKFNLYGQDWKTRVRLLGYDSPEMKPNKLNKDYNILQKGGQIARDAFEKRIRESFNEGRLYCMFGKGDKYGRPLATLYDIPLTCTTFCQCSCFGGGTPRLFQGYYVKEDQKIINRDYKDFELNQWMIDNGFGFSYDGGTKLTEDEQVIKIKQLVKKYPNGYE